jgi:hypothetical protein
MLTTIQALMSFASNIKDANIKQAYLSGVEAGRDAARTAVKRSPVRDDDYIQWNAQEIVYQSKWTDSIDSAQEYAEARAFDLAANIACNVELNKLIGTPTEQSSLEVLGDSFTEYLNYLEI